MEHNREKFVTSSTALSSDQELKIREEFLNFFLKYSPVPENELLDNLGLFIRRRILGRILFMHELYQKIIGTRGSIIEFGCRWGQNLALFENFRGLYEPYYVGRKVIGFDTFSGFTEIKPEDGDFSHNVQGGCGVTAGYENTLDYILRYHEQESPISHVKKYELIKGDASETFPQYLKSHPEAMIALAYFDMDLYQPTKDCLKALLPHMPKGGVIGFDQLNYFGHPGETVALYEVLGETFRGVQIKYSGYEPSLSYIIL